MYKIALVCENGASTGLVVTKMIEAANKNGIEADVAAYPYSQLSNLVDTKDFILLGPQLAYKKATFIKQFPALEGKLDSVAPVDFGMMNGEKILNDTIKRIDEK
ncbi:MAG: PTS sugar transporter subunit IIB [Erysipelotrichaceae bacterium]|nr:PTS sugar transporter subunit IIB [Erysipelotrichaceae bacterium]